jgi:sulfate adenylyltransferase subunit 1 (EFTu-like GTPase family)
MAAEREQGKGKFIVADTPGLSSIPATWRLAPRPPISPCCSLMHARESSRKHAVIAIMSLIGVRDVVAVNKMDLVGYDAETLNLSNFFGALVIQERSSHSTRGQGW